MSNHRLRLDKDPDQLYKFKFKVTPHDGVLQVKPEEARDAAGAHGKSGESSNKKHQSSLADDSLAASSLHQASTLPKLSKASQQSTSHLRYPHMPQNSQESGGKAMFLDGSTAVENVSVISDKNSTQPKTGAPAKDLTRANRDRTTMSKWNFLEMRKQEALYTVDKQTIKNLKEDPVLLERIIRNNRAAEINHFVSVVKKKAEKDEAEVANLSKANLDTFETYLFSSDKHIRSSLNNYKVGGSQQSAQVAAKYKKGLEPPTRKYLPRYPHVSRSVNNLPEHAQPKHAAPESDKVVDYHKRIAQSLNKKDESLDHSASGLMYSQVSQAAEEDMVHFNLNVKKKAQFTNTWRYDGNEEITKLETHMQSFMRKERSKKFIIRVPLEAKVQNKHLNDYYLVRRTQKLLPPVEPVEAPKVEEFVPRKVGFPDPQRPERKREVVIESPRPKQLSPDATDEEEESLGSVPQDSEETSKVDRKRRPKGKNSESHSKKPSNKGLHSRSYSQTAYYFASPWDLVDLPTPQPADEVTLLQSRQSPPQSPKKEGGRKDLRIYKASDVAAADPVHELLAPASQRAPRVRTAERRSAVFRQAGLLPAVQNRRRAMRRSVGPAQQRRAGTRRSPEGCLQAAVLAVQQG